MKGSIQDKQRAIQTPSNVLWIMQPLATFQNMMNNIYLMKTDEGWILIYIEDILIFLKEKEDLQKLTLQVLKKLKDNNLFVNLDKCTFKVKEWNQRLANPNNSETSPILSRIRKLL